MSKGGHSLVLHQIDLLDAPVPPLSREATVKQDLLELPAPPAATIQVTLQFSCKQQYMALPRTEEQIRRYGVARMARAINIALLQLVTRAERSSADVTSQLYVDVNSGLERLSVIDHQVVFGRRGTGKTATLIALKQRVTDLGDSAVLIDLRMIGSAGIYADPQRLVSERATRLLADVLRNLVETLVDTVVQDDDWPWDDAFGIVDRLLALTADVRMTAGSESADGGSTVTGPNPLQSVPLSEPGNSVGWSVSSGELGRELASLVNALPIARLWVLLDEWSSVPLDLQPILAQLLRVVLVPVPGVSLKIAATPQFTNLTTIDAKGNTLGIELGADAMPVDLDSGLAFGGDAKGARGFFRELLFRHVRHRLQEMEVEDIPRDVVEFENAAFDQPAALSELSLAAEGVPRDALNVAARAAARAGDLPISVEDVRTAAREWYANDKAPSVMLGLDGDIMLRWIFDRVIGRRRASGFLVARDSSTPLIDALEAARILHLIRRGVTAKDQPDMTYDAYRLDFGCYVDLLATSDAPQGLFRAVADDDDENTWVTAPNESYRSVKDALLDPRLTPAIMDAFDEMIDSHLPEEEYQRFLADHPIFLDPFASELIPKQKLGLEHVTDYAVRRHDGRWLLVEIEKPQDRIFTNANDFTSGFSHAFGQVLDFQRWVAANVAYARQLLPGITSPRGLLIIGRRNTLDVANRDKLQRFVDNSATIEVLTFDDLASNARALYKNLNGSD